MHGVFYRTITNHLPVSRRTIFCRWPVRQQLLQLRLQRLLLPLHQLHCVQGSGSLAVGVYCMGQPSRSSHLLIRNGQMMTLRRWNMRRVQGLLDLRRGPSKGTWI